MRKISEIMNFRSQDKKLKVLLKCPLLASVEKQQSLPLMISVCSIFPWKQTVNCTAKVRKSRCVLKHFEVDFSFNFSALVWSVQCVSLALCRVHWFLTGVPSLLCLCPLNLWPCCVTCRSRNFTFFGRILVAFCCHVAQR